MLRLAHDGIDYAPMGPRDTILWRLHPRLKYGFPSSWQDALPLRKLDPVEAAHSCTAVLRVSHSIILRLPGTTKCGLLTLGWPSIPVIIVCMVLFLLLVTTFFSCKTSRRRAGAIWRACRTARRVRITHVGYRTP